VNPGLEKKELTLDGAHEIVHTFGEAALQAGKLEVGKQTLTILKPVK